jgi:hypothetical protein
MPIWFFPLFKIAGLERFINELAPGSRRFVEPKLSPYLTVSAAFRTQELQCRHYASLTQPIQQKALEPPLRHFEKRPSLIYQSDRRIPVKMIACFALNCALFLFLFLAPFDLQMHFLLRII